MGRTNGLYAAAEMMEGGSDSTVADILCMSTGVNGGKKGARCEGCFAVLRFGVTWTFKNVRYGVDWG